MTKATQSGMEPKPVRWIGSSKADVSAFPEDVKRRVGGAIWEAQIGLKAPFAKPLKGFGGAGVLEVVDASTATRTVRPTQSGSLASSTSFTLFRRNPGVGSQHPSRRWI